MRGEHVHHIIPKYAGGDDSPENLVSLTVEDHAIAHLVRWKVYGDYRDKLAWMGLSGTETDREVLRVEAVKYSMKTDNPMWRSENRKIASDNMKGDRNPMRRFPEKNPFKGKSFVKGRKWYNNGKKNIYLNPNEIVPEGFVPGMKYSKRKSN